MNKEMSKKIAIPVTSEINQANGSARRNSGRKGKEKPAPSSSNSHEKLIPHYLRPPTGSCHDYCKYGRSYAFETQERHPVLCSSLCNHDFTDKKQRNVMEQRGRKNSVISKVKGAIQKGALSIETNSSTMKDFLHIDKADSVVGPGGLSIRKLSLHNRIGPNGATSDDESSTSPASIKFMIHSVNDMCIMADANKSSNRIEDSSEGPVSVKFMSPSDLEKKPFQNNATLTINEGSHFSYSNSSHLAESTLDVSAYSKVSPLNYENSIPAPAENSLTGQADVLVSVSQIFACPGSVHKSIVSAHGPNGSSKGSMSMNLETLSTKNSGEDLEYAVAGHPIEFPSEAQSTQTRTCPNSMKPVLTDKSSSRKQQTSSGLRKTASHLKQKALHGPNKQFETFSAGKRKQQATKVKPVLSATYEFSSRNGASERNKYVPSHDLERVVQKKLSSMNMIPSKLKKNNPPSSKKIISSAKKPIAIKNKASLSPKRKNVPSKEAISLKPVMPSLKSSSLLVPSGGLTNKKNLQYKVSQSVRPSKLERDGFKLTKDTLSLKPCGSGVSSIKLWKNSNKRHASPVKKQKNELKGEELNGSTSEKTLYVVSSKPMASRSKTVQQKLRNNKLSPPSITLSTASRKLSLPSGSSHGQGVFEDSESVYTEASGSIVSEHGIDIKTQTSYCKTNDEERSRRPSSVHPDIVTPTPHKLKFRPGRVVSPQSECNVARRLRFRQVGAVSRKVTSIQEFDKRSYSKEEQEYTGSKVPELESSTVLLRHQYQQEKKDTQSLFNDVIEETASKLVEARKSKVKALVGAFETVISLQESKVGPAV